MTLSYAWRMVALTLSGPDTYYDYQGSHLGVHYLLCQQFASHLGVRLRMEVCRDTAELLSRMAAGDADMIALPMEADSLLPGWQVGQEKPDLQQALADWYKPGMLDEARRQEQQMLTKPRVTRRVHAPMLRRGVISYYDDLFKHYSRGIGWDWRLVAAQAYQESTFDPEAVSWAGAKGLMQIMPGTADHLGLPRDQLTDPEQNLAAATRYLHELERSTASPASWSTSSSTFTTARSARTWCWPRTTAAFITCKTPCGSASATAATPSVGTTCARMCCG